MCCDLCSYYFGCEDVEQQSAICCSKCEEVGDCNWQLNAGRRMMDDDDFEDYVADEDDEGLEGDDDLEEEDDYDNGGEDDEEYGLDEDGEDDYEEELDLDEEHIPDKYDSRHAR